MQLGVVGLGRMGANMVRRLLRRGHQCVIFDTSSEVVNELVCREGSRRQFAVGPREEARTAASHLADGTRSCRG